MKIQEEIKKIIEKTLKALEIEAENFNIEHPENADNGDYATNVAMVCAKKMGVNPKELAESIVTKMKEDLLAEEKTFVEEVSVAGPGFINFYLSRGFFIEQIDEILKQKEDWGKNRNLAGKKVMIEYTQPNPFKPLHIGHLMSNAIGESISRIVEFSGAKTIRANYQGDVGPHVAKAIYGILKFGLPEETDSVLMQAQYIGKLYAKGNDLYETDENAKKEIEEINKKVYDRSDAEINKIYDWGRKITLEAFEEIYEILGTKFDKYYFESEVANIGKKLVEKNIGKVFEKSDGAVVFHAEKYDAKLHTRVFINSHNLPTYEAKELGLTLSKFKKSLFSKKLDLSIVTTAVEQAEYMKVVQKAISLINPELESRMKHVTHGMMRLASGKMSSRRGNVITGEALLQDSIDVILDKVRERNFTDAEKVEIAETVGVAALKYSILRSALGSDIIYDFEKSISFDGDSGPYLQYTTVRANSILQKEKDLTNKIEQEIPEETSELERKLYQFTEIVERAYQEFAPHYITNYLTELASAFNSFYGNNQVLDPENKFLDFQINLVKAFSQTMQNGLWLLGIKVPEKM
jgi:arginyl-tRNA synthetase